MDDSVPILSTHSVLNRHPFEGFDSSRGYTTRDLYNAAEELRMAGAGSNDPIYRNSGKNK